jgi:hypothetical protein
MNAMSLVEFFNYDHKYLSLALLMVEQREGREVVDRLLESIAAPEVKKNAKYYVDRLRRLLEMEEQEVTGGS